MNHRIALNFEDGVTCFIHAAPGETVADAAYRQGINIPLDCRDGILRTCKCLAEAGRYALGQDYIDDALSAEEAARGYVLTCQMRAESDCVLRVPASSTLCRTGQARYEARISEVRQLSPSTIGPALRGEALASLAFLPGQYVNLQVPGSEQRRAYLLQLAGEGRRGQLPDPQRPRWADERLPQWHGRAGDSLAMDGPLAVSTCARFTGHC